MGVGDGDRLARGLIRASFGPLSVSQSQWDKAVGKSKRRKKSNGKRSEKDKNGR